MLPSLRFAAFRRSAPITLALLPLGCAPGEEAVDEAPAPIREEAPRESERPRPIVEGLRGAFRAVGQGRFEEARAAALAYRDADPAEGQADFVVGLAYEKQGNYEAARTWFAGALEKSPGDVIVHDYLGRSLFLLGRLAEARREFEALGAALPDEPKAAYGLGLVELEASRFDAARAAFERALELFERSKERDPRLYRARQGERAECHARLGEVHFALGRYEEARDELLLSTRLAPAHVSAFYTLSLVHRRLGEDEEAARALAHYEARKAELSKGGTE